MKQELLLRTHIIVKKKTERQKSPNGENMLKLPFPIRFFTGSFAAQRMYIYFDSIFVHTGDGFLITEKKRKFVSVH